ncbi:MAG: hypothetical protein CMJ94_07765 [Planctomycetes bacterium]|nr:hypothetical protein [Planctomycetota bacterium]
MRSLSLLALGSFALIPACAQAPADSRLPEEFAASTDWVDLTLDDFVNVNGDETTWRQEGDTIVCTGKPLGGARSLKQYDDFLLEVEWNHHEHAGNSGIFLWCPEQAFTDLPPGTLPRTGIEVQVLDLGYEENWERDKGAPSNWFTSHGDIFPVGASSMQAETPQIVYAAADGAEYTVGNPDSARSFPSKRLVKPAGEWNHYAIAAIDGQVSLWVNGERVNGASFCKPFTGYLALEAEGALIEFRNLRICELENQQ